jgi:hypothetical protein
MMDGRALASSDCNSELSRDFFGCKNIRDDTAPKFHVIICSLAIEIFTAAYMQVREGNEGLARAMPTKKIIERTNDLHCISSSARIALVGASDQNLPHH